MRILEFFSGTGSFGKQAEALGHEVTSLDISDEHDTPDILTDLLTYDYTQLDTPDFCWFSIPCTSFSRIMRIQKDPPRDIDTLEPLNQVGEDGDALLNRTIEIIHYFSDLNRDMMWAIENPADGYLEYMKQMVGLRMETTSYCRYGMPYRKNTNIWSNFPLDLKSKCTTRMHHVARVRGLPKSVTYRIPTGLTTDILGQAVEHLAISKKKLLKDYVYIY